ncbi:MAG: sugar transferase [Oscillospiraceae bacterium]|nr:sugar transferase [Oscillospiraceae bacterium]
MQSEVLALASTAKVDSEERTYSEIKETEIEITETSHGEGNPDGDKGDLITREEVESSKKVYRLIKRAEDFVFIKKPFYDFVKRLFDVIVSLLGLIVLSPVFAITAICIMVDDFGNPFFVQERTGKNGKNFKMYKFRSMVVDAEKLKPGLMEKNKADGPIFKIEDDPRITKVGRFIRKTSLDELPQLINVVKGEMSIIGPRPLPVSEQAACDEYQSQRLLVKPGLSCYAALDPTAHDDFDKWIEYDLRYIKERSFLTDIKIILGTVGVVFKRDNQ